MKVAIVTGIHGDEPTPTKISVANATLIISHKAALEKNVRFIDEDLNRCFPGNAKTFEGKLAKNILQQLKDFDLVLDIHTTTAKTKAFTIVTKNKYLAQFSPLPVVFMQKHIASDGALIDHVDGVSLEFAHTTPKQEMEHVIEMFISNMKSNRKTQVEKFEVFAKGDQIQNMQDVVHILHGEKHYPKGFIARRVYL